MQLDKCFIMIHPSLEETFGNIFIEAMARGLICIGGENAGAAPYIIENEKTGFLCDVTKSLSIAAQLEIVTTKKDNLDELRKKALNKVVHKYSNSSVAKMHIHLYDSLIDNDK